MKKKTVAIDLDDTLNTLVDDWLTYYNKDYDDNLQKESIINWDIASFTKPECGKKLFNYLLIPSFFQMLGVQPYAQEVTKWMIQYFELYIVTAYQPITCLDKCIWIEKGFDHIPTKNIVFCNNKGLIRTDLIIDDGSHNIVDFHNANKSGLPIIFDKPWNRDLGNNYVRAKDWREVKENLKEIFWNELK